MYIYIYTYIYTIMQNHWWCIKNTKNHHSQGAESSGKHPWNHGFLLLKRPRKLSPFLGKLIICWKRSQVLPWPSKAWRLVELASGTAPLGACQSSKSGGYEWGHHGGRWCPSSLAKLVDKSNHYGLWVIYHDISIVNGIIIHLQLGGAPPCVISWGCSGNISWLVQSVKSPMQVWQLGKSCAVQTDANGGLSTKPCFMCIKSTQIFMEMEIVEM